MNRSAISVVMSVVLGVSLPQQCFCQHLVPSLGEIQDRVPAPDLSELKIVVVAGEDGVNIVKKKTAVQPVVEVRDRNNTPVAGIIVGFTSPNLGPSAVFSNGSRSISLVTDSAGRAAITGMRPVGTGAFRITVNASMQGRTVATTTIGQTNYLTPAAASSGAASSGAGGGLSTTAIVGIVAGVAAAAAVGIGLGLSGGKTVSGTISGPGTATVGASH
jgi:hypothetical protein